MTTDAERSLEVLTRALDQTEQVLSEIPADQLADPTPCIDWDVAALVAHVVADTQNFVMMARGDDFPCEMMLTPLTPRSGAPPCSE